MYVKGGGLTDILLSIPDFSIGYVLWYLNTNSDVKPTAKTKREKWLSQL